jgi:DNA-binding Xre family transcriptional regulator
MELGGDSAANGLAQLVLTLVKLLHDLLEKQAIRRMEAGRLSDEQAETIEQLCEAFDLEPGDLDLSLGSVQGIDATDLGRTDQDR